MRLTHSLSTVTLASLLLCGTALAQTESDTAEVSEVVVTASKRPERIIDVPYAVTAVGGAEIAERGAMDLKDLQYSIPGLQIVATIPGSDRVQMRGINAGTGTGLPVVGVYVDDVGISVDQQQRDVNFPLVDIDRIEVLRGPQGTLYGQGSVAGTIRYITRNPSLTQADGFVEANVYSQEEGDVGYRVNGAVGAPLIQDKLGVRLVAGYDRQAGWIDYPNIGVKNANETNTAFIRGKLLFKPSEQITASLLYQYYKLETDTVGYSTGGTNTTNIGTYLAPAEDKSHLLNGMVDWDLGFATLTSSTGYVKREYFTAFPFPFPPTVINTTTYEQFTQELRLTSKDEGPLRWTAGAWYRNFESLGVRSSTLIPALNRTGTDPVNSDAIALFGDVTWVLSPQWEASVGLRYYKDWRESFPPVQKADFQSTSPRFNLLYRWSDKVSTYVQAVKGFRSGGFNGDGSTFDAESLWNYEVGTKASMFGGRLYLDGAIYYLDYSNRQSQNIAPAGGGVSIAVTTNGGAASGFGGELSMTAKLPSNLRLDATVSYNDVRFDNLTLETDPGERFGGVSPMTASISLSQRFPLSDDMNGFWRVDYQHADGYEAIFRGLVANPAPPPAQIRAILVRESTRPLDFLNARIGIERGDMSLMFDVQNILNEDDTLFPFTTGILSGVGGYARPRSFGVTLNWKWR